MMELHELKNFVEGQHPFEIRVIGSSTSRFYQVELEDMEGGRHRLCRSGKPVLFRSLEDVYLELKRAGIHQAYLVQQIAEDELVGRNTHYLAPLASRTPLAF